MSEHELDSEKRGRPGADEIEALGRALEDLRSEIRTRFPSEVTEAPPAPEAEEPRRDFSEARARRDSRAGSEAGEGSLDLARALAELAESLGAPSQPSEWMELFDALRKRAGSIGMAERSGEVDDFGFEATVLESVRPLLDFLFETYWRVHVLGTEHLPRDGAALFVANRGGILPYDGLMLTHALERERLTGGRPRFLVADWLITLPFAQANLARVGGVRACRENADRLLARGHSVVAFPEGVKGAAKLFRDRYRLQRFGRGGAVRAALENRVPLVPVGIAGSEEAHPVLARSTAPPVRALGLPFVPVTPTFPWLGPLGLLPLPTQWVISIGEPMDLERFDPADADDPLLVDRLNESLRERIGECIRSALRERETVWG